jgi:hypothetical protein
LSHLSMHGGGATRETMSCSGIVASFSIT